MMHRAVFTALALALTSCGSGVSDRRDSAGEIGELGFVCGSTSIVGIPQDRVTSSRSSQCGIDQPVRVHSVAGVSLRQRPLLNCTAARALDKWVRQGAKPAVASINQKLESLDVVSHYACRTRNNQPGGRVSEHGKGNAIDIAGVRLEDGVRMSVLEDWGKGSKGKALAAMRKSACGPFGVVLGPGSDRFHRDHFHFDVSNMARKYCR